LKEWITPSLVTDGGLGSVPRQHRGFIRQSEDFFANTSDQQRMITAWEICPADASGEKYVAGEQDLLGRGVKAEASRAMAGNEKDRKGRAAQIYVRRFLDQKVRPDRFCLKKESPVLKKIRFCHERDTIFVVSDLAIGCSLDLGRVIEMVRVTVGKDQQIEPDSQIPDPIRRPSRSIDQDISARRLNQVRVGIENTPNKSLKVEHSE
jgi:hypothetical protein